MKRFVITILAIGAAILLAAGLSNAYAASSVSYNVGVCDPLYPQRCIKPNADGSINTSGAGGGGAITAASGSYASGALSAGSIAAGAMAAGSAVDGHDLTLGATTDAAATQGSTGTISAKLRTMTSQLNTISTNTAASLPAGSALIGNVGGPETNGAAVTGGGQRSMGSDGTNARDILTDTSGRQRSVGAAASGAAVAGDPVRIGASDGTNTQNVCSDTAGVFCSPKAGTANRVVTKTNLTLNTNTTVCPTATAPISTEIYFTTGGVGISLAGGTLTTATIGTTASTTPDLSFATANTLYTLPVAATNAITAYGAAGIVVCIQNVRQ